MNCIVFRVNGTDGHSTPYNDSAAAEAAANAYEAALDAAHGEDWTLVLQNFVQPRLKFCVLIDDADPVLVPPPVSTAIEDCGDQWYEPPPPFPQGVAPRRRLATTNLGRKLEQERNGCCEA